jgi:hypothetical protein
MKNVITLSLKVFIGLVFLLSAYSKLIAPGIVEIILVDHGIVSSREIAAVIVHLLVGFELALGLLFFQPYSIKKIVIPASFLFLIGFTVYLVYTGFILNDKQNCGCFGEMIKMPPVESIIKNIVLMGLLFVLYKFVEEKKNYLVPVISLVLAVAFVFVAMPIKSQKDFKFAKYTSFEGKGRVDLSNGNKLVAILNLECDHCQNLVKELSALEKTATNFPETYALLFSEGNVSLDSFRKMTGFDFPYKMIGATEFFDLIGQSPPRIYWLQDGKLKEIWDKDFVENISKNFPVK